MNDALGPTYQERQMEEFRVKGSVNKEVINSVNGLTYTYRPGLN